MWTIGLIGLSSDNIDFLDFLRLDICECILISNKLKIHLETGNIYFNDQDTNESIFDFFYKQQDSTKGIIDYDFVYSGDYVGYFDWLIRGFDSYQKTRLDIISNKNAKYLFYQYNDILQQNDFEVKKIRHSIVTDDYFTTEEVQSQNWQYFVESVLDACSANGIGKKIDVKQAQLIKNSAENITICKTAYQSFYNQVAQNLNFTISNLTADEMS